MRQRVRGWRPPRLDVLLSVGTIVVALTEMATASAEEPLSEGTLPFAAAAIATGLVLLFRQLYPVTGLALFTLMQALGGMPQGAWRFAASLILMHAVGSAAEIRSRQGLAGLTAVIALTGLMEYAYAHDVAEFLINLVFAGVAYGGGILYRRQTTQTLRLAERNARLEVEREEQARRAVATERARIARELHDVISHNVSVMTLQAGGVRLLLDGTRQRERDLLNGIEDAGRETVGELQLMLGMLRETTDPAVEAPPGLGRLNELIARLRGSGLNVETRTTGIPGDLPPGLDQSVFRVIQESFTNILKHSGAARADVEIGYTAAELVVRITDDGSGPSGNAEGHGLIGMRERTVLFGGDLEAGPGPDGGFQVLARWPLTRPGVAA